MKILLINKFLYPKGGAESYLLRLGTLLKEQGHEVEYFGMEDDRNVVGNSLGEAVSAIDFSTGIRKNLTAPFRIIYCAEARRKLRHVLKHFCPDVVHLNNIQYHLTPSVILAVRDYRQKYGKSVRLFSTAHDYQFICPSHGLFGSDLQPCERCLQGSLLPCLKQKCVKGSYLKSLLAVIDALVWKHSKAYEQLDAIICPSEFMKTKLESDPRFKGKCVTLHNFAEAVEEKSLVKEDYVLEFGHLSEEKGTLTLLEAAKNLPQFRFVFAGFGPAEEAIRQLPNTAFVGYQSGEELECLIRKAKLTVVPSLCHDNCPYSVIESQLYGTLVIGSRRGGIPELLRGGGCGLLFEAGNPQDLAEKICRLWNDEKLLKQFEDKGKIPLESAESYYQKLLKLYGGQNENL